MHTSRTNAGEFVSFFLRQLLLPLFRFLISHPDPKHIVPLALLIDGDNVSPALIHTILAEANRIGAPAIRRIYGNWGNANMQRWRELAVHHGFEQRHHGQVVGGKNAADIALVIDAMDILYGFQIQHFCLVTSDSDYTPLVLRLRQAGCIVLGICDPQKAPAALVNAFSLVLTINQTNIQAKGNKAESNDIMPTNITSLVSKQAKQQEEQSDPPDEQGKHLIMLLQKAYEQALESGKGEWIPSSCIGSILRQLEPDFKPKNYGYKGLDAIFGSPLSTKYFEARTIERGNQLEVRKRGGVSTQEENGTKGQASGSSSQLVL